MSALRFKRVTIIGVGLIGASLAMALKKAAVVDEIVGAGRTEKNLQRAKELGIIDAYSTSYVKAVNSSELVILASPVGTFRGIVEDIGSRLHKGAIVTDVGSVKGELVIEMERLIPEGRFSVGSHPIAGSDRSGLDYADSELFRGTLTIITPTERTNRDAVETVAALCRAVGASVVLMNPQEHDRVLALTSHLPHVVSYALVNTLSRTNREYIEYTGGGFRDTTRIASSSPELWADILLSNKDNVLQMIKIYKDRLKEIEDVLKNKDRYRLMVLFEEAKRLRDSIS